MVPLLRRLRRPCRARWAIQFPARQGSIALSVVECRDDQLRLGEGVFSNGTVGEEAMKATCAVLARMAGLYRKLDVVGVRVVATSAIRDTRNRSEERKSTRLNSSHLGISYAVFCL